MAVRAPAHCSGARLGPMRERRREFAADPGYVIGVIRTGTEETKMVTESTVSDVNGRDKSDHSAAQIQAIGRAPSGMTRALTR